MKSRPLSDDYHRRLNAVGICQIEPHCKLELSDPYPLPKCDVSVSQETTELLKLELQAQRREAAVILLAFR